MTNNKSDSSKEKWLAELINKEGNKCCIAHDYTQTLKHRKKIQEAEIALASLSKTSDAFLNHAAIMSAGIPF